ncbi:MAG: manganese catalase family protein [Clostridiales bacterium]|nr:manganese catalase family protein [Clostridiales bacterium]
MAHLEIIGAIVSQLTSGASAAEMREAGLDAAYADHGLGVYPMTAAGSAFSADMIQSTGNPVADLYEDMAAEQKAKATYEYLLDLIDDPDAADPIKFLREREVVHFQRFGEALRCVEERLENKHMFYGK